jgi:plastocyanin
LRKSLLASGSLLALVAAAVAVAPGALAKSHATTSSVVHLTAKKAGLAYNTKTLTAKAGRIKLVFTNLSPLKHNVRLEVGEKEFGGTKTIATGTTTAYVTLKKGKYHFYCSVAGHEDAGMSGYLTVS